MAGFDSTVLVDWGPGRPSLLRQFSMRCSCGMPGTIVCELVDCLSALSSANVHNLVFQVNRRQKSFHDE